MKRNIALWRRSNAGARASGTANPTTRREVLASSFMIATIALVGQRSALADLPAATAEVEKFSMGRKAVPGRITIGLPEIAENGNSVPLAVVVDSPMTPEDHVTEVLLIADRNPRPVIATFRFTPMMGRAQASTRIRLAATQNVIVLANTSVGGLLIGQRPVKVTIGGCGG